MSDFHSHAVPILLWILSTLMQPVWVLRGSETHTEENQKVIHNIIVLCLQKGAGQNWGCTKPLSSEASEEYPPAREFL